MDQRSADGVVFKARPKPPAAAPAAPPALPQPGPKAPSSRGQLVAAREAVRNFLMSECQVREVRITKISPLPGEGGWDAAAEILVPDLTIKMLGLPLSQEVLEREFCTVELDPVLSVRSYELGAADQR